MRVGIMGLGYVGLPLAVAFAEQGDDVVGVDIDARKVEMLNSGRSYIEDIGSARLQAVAPRMEATTRSSNLSRCDAVLVCVTTPLTPNREPTWVRSSLPRASSPTCCSAAS
jgi:UDP-N-acetyl-D-glucosamine dehydrogenase